MGREKASGGVDGCGGSRSGRRSNMNGKKAKDKNTSSSSGCMSVIFNLFDIQHHQFRFHHPSFMSESTITSQQRSLESLESAMDVAPSSLKKVLQQKNLNIPMCRFQIKTNRPRFTDDLSECNISPSTKTPNLVARLMGLDLLPEYSSPRQSSSSTPATAHHRTHSLPATPRMSTTSRQSTDNTDYYHRLSLQLDKENCINNNNNNKTKAAQRRRSDIPVNGQNDDNLKSKYAKQITNQVRERISRRLGTDITNTVSPVTCNDRRRDSDMVLLKPKKSPAGKLRSDDSTKLIRLVDVKSSVSNLHKPRLMMKAVKDEKIKGMASERYDRRLKKKEMTSSQLLVSLPSNLNSSYKEATARRRLLAAAFGTEYGDIVKEIESEIVRNLVHEIAVGKGV